MNGLEAGSFDGDGVRAGRQCGDVVEALLVGSEFAGNTCCLALYSDLRIGKDGAPELASAFAQTSDGYLWLGAPAGLFRFDGVRFELFRSPLGQQLQSTNVRALFAPTGGGLWVGYTFGGFSFIRNGRITNFDEKTGSVQGYAQDKHGILWAATGTGLWRFDGTSWKLIGADWNFPVKQVPQVGFDREGILWAIVGARSPDVPKQLFFLPPGDTKFRKAGDNIFVESFTWDADHTVLTTAERRPREPGSGIELESSLPAWPILKKNSEQILDRANNLWVFPNFQAFGRHAGVLRHPGGEPLADIVSKVSPGNSKAYDINFLTLSPLVDREGGVWVGADTGVHRLSSSPLVEQELPRQPVNGPYFTLTPEDGRAVWISNGNAGGLSALYRIADEGHFPEIDGGSVELCISGAGQDILVRWRRRTVAHGKWQSHQS